MKLFFSTLPRNVIGCFKGRMILWHILAIAVTFILVASGLDWLYFRSTRNPTLREWMFPAAPIGALVPILLPFILLALGSLSRSTRTCLAAWAVIQAELIGLIISMAYKSATGRPPPPHDLGADMSHVFRFGFLRGGFWWGWPSSHTTVAFAMAVTLFTLFPKQKWLGWVAIGYALYIGVGVSMTIHWLSDFAAGAIIGTVIGAVVGRSFLRSQT